MTRGRLAIVLHSHMPYVEGFGTWPFGEEWLWEAVATSYLPLLALLERGAPLTLSLTPVLCDQLEAPGALDRCRAFLRDVRPASHRLDAEAARAGGDEAVAREIERAAGDYARALDALPSDLLGALRPYAAWTSAATHAVLPMLATDAAVRLQVRTGVAAHRARFGAWRGGFWLPECGYAPWLDPLLEEAGVHAVCVDLTDVLGRGDPRHLRPLATEGGPLLVPIDRATVELVWSDGGYPAARRLPRLPPPHRARPPPVGERRRGLRPGARRGARAGGRAPTSSRGSASASPAAGSPSARSTPSCSATGGTRGPRGSRRCSTRPLATASRSSPLDDALAERRPRAAARARSRRRDDVGHAARPRHVVGPARRRAGVGGAGRRAACRERGRRRAGPGAARAAPAAGERLGLPRDARARRPVPARARRTPTAPRSRPRSRVAATARTRVRNLAPHLCRAAFLEP